MLRDVKNLPDDTQREVSRLSVKAQRVNIYDPAGLTQFRSHTLLSPFTVL